MTFLIILLSIAFLVLLITYFKVDAFLSFVVVSITMGMALGIPVGKLAGAVDKGISNIMGDLTMILVLGAMLGKLIAESGAAQKIASGMVAIFGEKRIQWGLVATGFIVGIPLFFDVGFVLLVPLIFTISYKFKVRPIYIGLPMAAALSVTHGFTPPHPSPVALSAMFGADLGLTLLLGMLIAVPAIIIGGPLYTKTLKNIQSSESTLFKPSESPANAGKYGEPGYFLSFLAALLPVAMLIIATLLPYTLPKDDPMQTGLFKFIGAPSMVMLMAVIFATWSLGLKQGRKMKDIMDIYVASIKDIAPILLILAGSGVFKEVLVQSGVSKILAQSLEGLTIHPIILAWLVTSVIRGCVGSATVAAMTSASVLGPMFMNAGVHPSLMVLTLGAGSLMFSHVNDAGFWLFKEYFGLSMKDTMRSWAAMEAIVSIVGLICILILHTFMS